uniref:Histone H2A n=1 Tax=Elaeophora elaphi TaxID=1147741 RepID=A0A0R3RN20_9BILA
MGKPKATPAEWKSRLDRVRRPLRKHRCADRATASMYLTAIVAYFVTEILNLIRDEAKHKKKNKIHMQNTPLRIQNGNDLSGFLARLTISENRELPNINSAIFPNLPADMPSTSRRNSF